MWWWWLWLIGPIVVIGGGLTILALGVGLGANSLADAELDDATLTCFHCGRETTVGRKTCEHCGQELQS